jgi:hypothetical protein
MLQHPVGDGDAHDECERNWYHEDAADIFCGCVPTASAENCGESPTTVAPRNSGGAHWNANGSNQADAQLWGRRARCLRARFSARAAEPIAPLAITRKDDGDT